MTEEGKPPESLGEVKARIFKKTWIWVSSLPMGLKIIVGIVGALFLIVTARFNLLGNTYYDYSKKLIPLKLRIDPELSVVPISFQFEIEDQMGRRTGKLSDTYYTGDRVYLSFKAGSPCWITIIGVDSKKIYPVFRHKLSPSKIEKDQKYTLNFKLDNTVGWEIYYAIAAHENFDFEGDISPRLRRIFPEGNSKGPVFSNYSLTLPDKFTQKILYFNHSSRK